MKPYIFVRHQFCLKKKKKGIFYPHLCEVKEVIMPCTVSGLGLLSVSSFWCYGVFLPFFFSEAHQCCYENRSFSTENVDKHWIFPILYTEKCIFFHKQWKKEVILDENGNNPRPLRNCNLFLASYSPLDGGILWLHLPSCTSGKVNAVLL